MTIIAPANWTFVYLLCNNCQDNTNERGTTACWRMGGKSSFPTWIWSPWIVNSWGCKKWNNIKQRTNNKQGKQKTSKHKNKTHIKHKTNNKTLRILSAWALWVCSKFPGNFVRPAMHSAKPKTAMGPRILQVPDLWATIQATVQPTALLERYSAVLQRKDTWEIFKSRRNTNRSFT